MKLKGSFLFLFLICSNAQASEVDFHSLADAIFQAEGGRLGELYGIHTVSYKDEADARAICIRTCKNKFKMWDGKGDFLTFLSKKYCPVNAKVWEKNVRFFYARFKKQKENA